jgi:hypothetical protein
MSGGRSDLQRSCAMGQRVWKRQPDGGLIGLGIPELEAKQYEGKIKEGL